MGELDTATALAECLPAEQRANFITAVQQGAITRPQLATLIEGLGTLPCPTAEMVRYFFKRTALHISLVAQNLEKLTQSPEFLYLAPELRERGRVHDLSKYSPEEIVPYIWLTEYYRCKATAEPFHYPERMKEGVENAYRLHVARNPHHHQFHKNIGDMSTVDLLEMASDWTAMGQENGSSAGSALTYANKNIGSRIPLTQTQTAVLYRALSLLER